jgi:hypothetical protein
VALRKGLRLNDLWSARFVSTGEVSGSDVFGGQEARAASAAGDGSPRGPVVLTGSGSWRKPSSAGSDGIDPCAEAVKERWATRSFGVCRGGGARKARK